MLHTLEAEIDKNGIEVPRKIWENSGPRSRPFRLGPERSRQVFRVLPIIKNSINDNFSGFY